MVHWEGAPTSFGELTVSLCIRSPDAPHLSILIPVRVCVRADIVEDRNVEAGSMSQVIQGNKLTCMFTDTPPSLQQAYPHMSRSSLSPYNNGSGGGLRRTRKPTHRSLRTDSNLCPCTLDSSLPRLCIRSSSHCIRMNAAGTVGRSILVLDDRVLTLRMALPRH